MFNGELDGLFNAIFVWFILLLVLAPFGIWKIIEIILWAASFVEVSIKT